MVWLGNVRHEQKAAGRAARQQDGPSVRVVRRLSTRLRRPTAGGWHDTCRGLINCYQFNSALRLLYERQRQISLQTVQIKPATTSPTKKPRHGGAESTAKGQKLCRAVAQTLNRN